MRIGVISDTHDRVPKIEKTVAFFNEKNVAATLHCGDFCSPFSLMPYRELNAPLYAVFGNNDGEKAGIIKLFADHGWTLNERPWFFSLDGKKIAMLHEPARLKTLAQGGEYDLIVYGHTHERRFEKINGSLALNPGEGCGWVNGTASIAIVDLVSGDCRFEIL